jgi:hypothetical protein
MLAAAAAIAIDARGIQAQVLQGQAADHERPPSMEEWMDSWIKGQRDPEGVLQMSKFADAMYFLVEPIGWKPNPGDKLPSVNVPRGFVTDLASIPRPFFSLLRPDAEYAYAAIVHDYLYWTQKHPRATADLILRRGMEDFKVPTATVVTIYEAVRAGGQLAWNSNATLKKQGERRILKRFPTDPRTRWAEWKKQPNVFE